MEEYDKIADSLQRTGQSEKMIPYFLNELKSKPKNEAILRRLGYLYLENNQPELGEKYYREALVVNPKCAYCFMNIGRAYSLKNETKNALEYFDKSIYLAPTDALLYSIRAQQYEFTGFNNGEALIDFNKAIELDPKNEDYYILRGLFYSKQNNYSSAIADLNKAVAIAPKNFVPLFRRANFYYDNKMTKEALADINSAIALDSTQQSLYTARGAIYSVLKETKKSIADYTRSIELKPNDFFPYYYRALEKYTLEDMDGFCSDLQLSYALIVKNDPENPIKAELVYYIGNFCDSTKAGYYYQRGIAFYNLQQFDKAVQIYSQGVEKFPNNSMILSFRGNAYFELKNYEKAIADYYASIENKYNVIEDVRANQKHTGLANESVESYLNEFLASMQLSIAESRFALGQFEEALLEINKGIALAPNTKVIGKEKYFNVRGNVLLALGKYQQAIADFDKCIELNRSFSLAYVNRAIAKLNQNSKISIKSYSIRGIVNTGSFNGNWTLNSKSSLKKSDENAISALTDCNEAIEISPDLDFAFYIRGQIKKMLSFDDYCYDLLRAKTLGFPVELIVLGDCGK